MSFPRGFLDVGSVQCLFFAIFETLIEANVRFPEIYRRWLRPMSLLGNFPDVGCNERLDFAVYRTIGLNQCLEIEREKTLAAINVQVLRSCGHWPRPTCLFLKFPDVDHD